MDRVSTIFNSQATRLVITALIASFATLQVHYIWNDIRSKRKKEKLNEDLQRLYKGDHISPEVIQAGGRRVDTNGNSNSTGKKKTDAHPETRHDEDLIREQLARNYAFFGEEGMKKIREARVVVVGCGGVGSWAAMMLARTGIGHLRLIDFDYVTLSSLNRHASAVRADVGTPKVQSLKRTIESVAPWVNVDACIELWNEENEQEHGWLTGADWIIDAIDNISTKVDLLSYAHANKYRIISSMGAGAKTDPSHIQSADISETVADPLSRAVRRRLRIHPKHPVFNSIPVVYSTEVPNTTTSSTPLGLLPLSEEEFSKGSVHELAPFSDFRVRILPVLGMIPAIFGLHVATYITCDLGGRKIGEPLAVKGRRKLWEKLAKDLTARETRWLGLEKQQRIPLTDEEVGYVFEELHRSKSAFPPFASLTRPTLIRWSFDEPLSVANCVVMSPEDASKHEAGYRDGKQPEAVWGPTVAEAVKRRREEAEAWAKMVY